MGATKITENLFCAASWAKPRVLVAS